MTEKVWTFKDISDDAFQSDPSLNTFSQIKTDDDVDKYYLKLGKYLEKNDPSYKKILTSFYYEYNIKDIPAVQIPNKTLSDEAIEVKVFRDHFFYQLANAKNDGDAFVYIKLKRLGATAAIPDELVRNIATSNSKETMETKVLPILHFVENEDRYRRKKDAPNIREKFEDIIKDATNAYIGNNIGSKVQEIRDYIKKYNDPILEGEKQGVTIPQEDEVNPDLDVYVEERFEERTNVENYKDIVKFIRNVEEWKNKSDDEFEKEWQEAKSKWEAYRNVIENAPTSPRPITTPNTTTPQKPNDITEKSNVPKNVTQTSSKENETIKELSIQVNVKDLQILNLKEQLRRQEEEHKQALKIRGVEYDNLKKRFRELEVLLSKGDNESIIRQLQESNNELSEQNRVKKEDIDGYIDDIEEKNAIIADLKKQTIDLEKYKSLNKSKLFITPSIKTSSEQDISKFILVEGESIKTVFERFKEIANLKFTDMQKEQRTINSTGKNLPQYLYNLANKSIRDQVDALLDDYKAQGIQGIFTSLSEQMKSAMLQSFLPQSYHGKDRMKLEFSKDGETISEVTISNLSLQKLDSGERAYVIPMKDTEAYEKIYKKIPLLGKNVIPHEGRFIVSRSGYDPIEMSYRVDYDDLGEENLYYGKSFIFQQPAGIRIETNYINKKNHHLSSIVIPENLFQQNRAFVLSAPPTTKEVIVEEKEIFEVPIYQSQHSSSSSSEEEQEWPSDY